MTPATFDHAQRSGIKRIQANSDAVQRIAQEAEFVESDEPLPPLLLVARSSEAARNWITRWDYRLPTHNQAPTTGRFFAATELEQDPIASHNHEQLVRLARQLGATAFHEISIRDWSLQGRRHHAAALATALLFGERPLILPPKPPLPQQVLHTFTGAFGEEVRKQRRLNRIKDHRPPLPPPFTLSY